MVILYHIYIKMTTPKLQKRPIILGGLNPRINVQKDSGHLMSGRTLLGRQQKTPPFDGVFCIITHKQIEQLNT